MFVDWSGGVDLRNELEAGIHDKSKGQILTILIGVEKF